ncbi:MAG: hypothetical protein V1809_03955 [Planctomycetota bacterium]
MTEFFTLAALIATIFIVFPMVNHAIQQSAFLAETPMHGKLIAGCVTILGLIGMKRCMGLVLIPYGALVIAMALLFLFFLLASRRRTETKQREKSGHRGEIIGEIKRKDEFVDDEDADTRRDER